ncbi:MAG: HEAT repeat domain-containing protein [Isosphaeraceae bacterium]|nr:HEAT repeat domain-containing protein [Isosphaeraceae bacterium]
MLVNLACWIALALGAVPGERLPSVSSRLEPGRTAAVEIAATDHPRNLSILIALASPGHLPFGAPVKVSVSCGASTLTKTLHQGDADVVWTVRQPADVTGRVTLEAGPGHAAPLPFAVRIIELGEADDDGVAFECEDNDTPERANPLTLGQTVYGWADDRPYRPLGEETTEAERTAGRDWFRFEFASETPRLAFFGIEFIDRDVPPDVRLYQLQGGKLVEYTQGIDPQAAQREQPPRPGANKFTTRVLTRGTYYVLVDACQPDYQLRTKLYPVPPYLGKDEDDPLQIAEAARRAVRVAMDFQLLAGDSWHANTPRKGHPMDRIANPHHETSTCIACHPTHFTTQSALTALRHGYKVEEPFALKFLTERLYNNPVPFYGSEEALWARMIPAPANVLGRLSTMTMDFEDLVTGPERNNTHAGIAAFLKLYYDGRKALPKDESNGNNPVSRYKVATDSWRQLDEIARRTGDERYAQTRDLIADLLPTGQPAHLRDLAAQTIGLCLAGPARYRDKIEANVQRLLELQRPDGQWSIPFDPKAAPSQMQTGECLYALALAGLSADHPAMRQGAAALLREQKPFGGWLDLNPYEQFRTPFRETQWALMALSRLYPGPGSKGWNGPLGPQPKRLRADSVSHLIRDLERIWDVPDPDLERAILAQLDHESPLVRLAACSALARVGGPTAVTGLVTRLGDESKAVRRASAEALRLIGNRLNGNRKPDETAEQADHVSALIAALRSPDDRTRRGATRVFAAHFRELSQQFALADALLERLDDADPVVQMQAIKGLWRWWYWRADLGLRNRIEDRLIAKLAEPTHPWVRRNLIEALYILGDENIRYLYNNWLPALADPKARERATAAQHATVNRLGAKYVAVLARGNPLQREGVLRAIAEFPERPEGKGRVGNDIEPMLFYDDALPKVSAALVGQMADPDPTIRRLALQALIALRGYRNTELSLAVLARQGDPDPSVREWASTMVKEFPLRVEPGPGAQALLAVVDELMGSALPEAKVAALGVLARLGDAAPEVDRGELVIKSLDDPSAEVRAAALRALPAFPRLLALAEVRAAIRETLDDVDPEARVEAIRLALDHRGITAEKTLRKALEDEAPAHRIALLSAIAASKTYAADLRLVGVVSSAVVDENSGVREKALQVIQTHPTLVANPAVEEGLRELSRSDNPRQREIASALLKSRGRSSASNSGKDVLDLAYFEAKVLPIFNTPGEDGQTCMGCHRSHTILKMVPPDQEGRWSPQAVRANYRAALRVVNLINPAESLLLGKPTWEAAEEAEAQNDPTKKAHAGGVRFEPKTSPEYQAILDWINGARLEPKGEPSASR